MGNLRQHRSLDHRAWPGTARHIVTELDGRFAGAANAEKLAARLDEAWRFEMDAPPLCQLMARDTWDTQVATLERVMERIVA